MGFGKDLKNAVEEAYEFTSEKYKKQALPRYVEDSMFVHGVMWALKYMADKGMIKEEFHERN